MANSAQKSNKSSTNICKRLVGVKGVFFTINCNNSMLLRHFEYGGQTQKNKGQEVWGPEEWGEEFPVEIRSDTGKFCLNWLR